MPRYRRTGAGNAAEDERARYLRAVCGGSRPRQTRLRTSLRRTGLRRMGSRHRTARPLLADPDRRKAGPSQPSAPARNDHVRRRRCRRHGPGERGVPRQRASDSGSGRGSSSRSRVKVRPSARGMGSGTPRAVRERRTTKVSAAASAESSPAWTPAPARARYGESPVPARDRGSRAPGPGSRSLPSASGWGPGTTGPRPPRGRPCCRRPAPGRAVPRATCRTRWPRGPSSRWRRRTARCSPRRR